MHNFIATGAVLAAAVSGVAADLCATGSQQINGNWYCQAVKAITYTGVGGSGSYKKVTNMDGSSGACSSSPFGYSGSMSPLDEEVSLHFRGPVQLKQFAVYTPSSSGSSSKLKEKRSAHARRHGHQHFHEHQQEVREIQKAHEEEKRAVGDIVVATINGKVVSWVNAYAGAATSTAAAATTAATSKVTSTVTAAGTTITSTVKAVSAAAISSASSAASSAAASSAAKSSTAAAAAASGAWSQIAYYNSADGTAHGLTFLNHFGGSGSGVFDYKFGNSLSYASADGKSGASSPQVLKDVTLSSNTEIVIQSDKECKSGSCGYTRPGAVSYHGFDGAHKAFFFEFSMPLDGNRGTNGDMPAIWMLNNQIPNTIQYGPAECSCWTSGCGEFDIFEVLDSGNTRCKSTLHGNIAGGDSDYFVRPTSGTIKAALVLYDDNIHIQILDSNTSFGSSMSASAIANICSATSTQNKDTSVFALS
ncbi:hypothetical protein B0A49_06108 [Cryomyces minteri]|uniref:glucan endo-1,3-beta-D-glucosidase n=1 Tax=Cryomyces minteri TaxID=331657 RepID=A0A4U0WUW5_9PEZI|nr:hypothetical protein B0A49_06108 [Cryomyces minteri]